METVAGDRVKLAAILVNQQFSHSLCPWCGNLSDECVLRGNHICEKCNCVINVKNWWEWTTPFAVLLCSSCYISWYKTSFRTLLDVKKCRAIPRKGIDATYAWIIVARRVGLYRDLQLLIAKLIWDGRFEDFY